MKTKALISFAFTAKLICTFVFAYADCWVSHVAANIILDAFSVYSFYIVQINCDPGMTLTCVTPRSTVHMSGEHLRAHGSLAL